jgi:hypothetical protein
MTSNYALDRGDRLGSERRWRSGKRSARGAGLRLTAARSTRTLGGYFPFVALTVEAPMTQPAWLRILPVLALLVSACSAHNPFIVSNKTVAAPLNEAKSPPHSDKVLAQRGR